MRKLSKKISMLMVLAMLVSLFSGVVSASAASVWSYKSTNGKFDVARNETIIMEKNEYADFDLYKEGEKVTKAAYTVVWESSDPDVVWVDATNGRLRADKFEKAEAGDKAMISANITNVETGVKAIRSFYIEIAADPVVEEPEYKVAVNFGEEAFVTGEKYDLVGVVTADGVAIEADVVFSIDGKAIEGAYAPTEAGEVTIVATATINGEEWTKSYDCIVVAKEVEITAIKQVELNKIRVTFNDAAFAAEAVTAANEDIEATFELTFNADKDDLEGDARVDHELYFVEADKDNTNSVYITAYKKLEEGLKYKLTYKKNDKALTYNWVDGTGIVPAKVEVSKFAYVVGDYRALECKVYNSDEVLISSLSVEDGGFDADLYPIEWSLVSEEDENFDFNDADGSIYFLEDGAKATVKVSIDMGYDDDGNEVADLTDTDVVYGTDATDNSVNPLGYLITDNYTEDTSKYFAADAVQTFFVGEGDYEDGKELYLYAYYETKNEVGTPTKYFIKKGESANDENNLDTVFTYQSKKTDIVAVDEETGRVYPVAPGTAKVYIKVEGNVIGYATVRVLKESLLEKFTVSVDGTSKLSVVPVGEEADYHGIWNQKITLKKSVTNQRGDNISDDVSISYEFTSSFKGLDGSKYEAEDVDSLFNIVDNGNGTYTITATEELTENVLEAGKYKSFSIRFTALQNGADEEDAKHATIKFSVKNVYGVSAKDPALTVSSTSIDMNLAKNLGDNDSTAKRSSTISLVQNDKDGYFVREVPFAVYYNKATAEAATGSGYAVVITKGDYALDYSVTDVKKVDVIPTFTEECTDNATYCTCGETFKVTLTPFDPDNGAIVKADKGTYKVRLYKDNDFKTTKKIQVSDSTKAITVQKTSEYITGFDTIDELAAAINFFSEGTQIKEGSANEGLDLVGNIVVDYDYTDDDTDRVYIYSIKTDMPVKAYNGKWVNSTDTTEVEIIVDKTFTVR